MGVLFSLSFHCWFDWLANGLWRHYSDLFYKIYIFWNFKLLQSKYRHRLNNGLSHGFPGIDIPASFFHNPIFNKKQIDFVALRLQFLDLFKSGHVCLMNNFKFLHIFSNFFELHLHFVQLIQRNSQFRALIKLINQNRQLKVINELRILKEVLFLLIIIILLFLG